MSEQASAQTSGEGSSATQSSGTLLSTNTPQQQAPAAGAGDQPAAQATGYDANDWRSKLPDELKGDQNLKTLHSVEALAKSFIHAQKMVGSEKIPLPGKFATDADWQQFYQKVGLPETLDKYEVKLPKEAKYVDQNLINDLKPIAHKSGVMPKQLESLIGAYEERIAKQMEADTKTREVAFGTSLGALKNEWGKAFDSRVGYAQKVVKDFGNDEIFDHVVNSELGNDLKLVRLLGMIGEKLYREDSLPSGSGGAQGMGVYDPATAREKANEIVTDLSHPYNVTDHPKHNAAVQEVQRLFEMGYPKMTD